MRTVYFLGNLLLGTIVAASVQLLGIPTGLKPFEIAVAVATPLSVSSIEAVQDIRRCR